MILKRGKAVYESTTESDSEYIRTEPDRILAIPKNCIGGKNGDNCRKISNNSRKNPKDL